jgi:hypothetical protein
MMVKPSNDDGEDGDSDDGGNDDGGDDDGDGDNVGRKSHKGSPFFPLSELEFSRSE